MDDILTTYLKPTDEGFVERTMALATDVKTGAIDKIDDIFGRGSGLHEIACRSIDLKETMQLVTFSKEKLLELAKDMPEQNRVQQALGRSNSLIDNRLMTATLTAGTSPSEVIKQCLSQIESRRTALEENQTRINNDNIWLARMQTELHSLKDLVNVKKNKLRRLSSKIDDNEMEFTMLAERSGSPEDLSEIRDIVDDLLEAKALISIEISKLEYKINITANKMVKKATGIGNAIVYVEGCIKEIASFNDMYKQVCKKHGWKIGEWDEKDLMNAEIHSKLRLAFTHAKHDIHGHGKIGNGTQHWIEGLGIPVTLVADLTREHLDNEKKISDKLRFPLKTRSDYAKYSLSLPKGAVFFNGYCINDDYSKNALVRFQTFESGERLSVFKQGQLVSFEPDKEDVKQSVINIVVHDEANRPASFQIKLESIFENSFKPVPRYVGIEYQEQWLDQMYEQFKYNWKDVIRRIGLDSLINDDFLYINKNKTTDSVPALDFNV